MRRSAALLLALSLIGACRRTVSTEADAGTAPKPAAHSPRTPAELPTDPEALALGNLSAEIAGSQQQLEKSPHDVAIQVALAGLLLQRGDLFARPTDYEEAAALADRAVGLSPGDRSALLLRARTKAKLHLFSAALEDVQAAEKNLAHGAAVEGLRATIEAATGDLDRALERRIALAKARPTIESLGALAMLRAERGEIDQAEAVFIEAQEAYRQVSPIPLAWLYFQEGWMWQRAFQPARARELYEAALLRVPSYAPAAAHLATLLEAADKARAIALLEAVLSRTDDPEFMGQLCALGVTSWCARASKGYDRLVADHPEAYAEHASRFWLGPGRDPKRALSLAEAELVRRKTSETYEGVLEAALAAGATERACAAAEEAKAIAHPVMRLVRLMERASKACAAR